MKKVYKKFGIFVFLLSILSSSAMAQGTPCVTSPIPSCVQDAINRGLNWLIANQDASGSWHHNNPGPTTPPSAFGVATASMAVIVFLENGYSPSNPTVCNAVNYIINNFHPGSGIYQNVAPTGPQPFSDKINYQTSLAVIALIEFEKNCGGECPIHLPDGIPDLHTLIQKAVNCIVGSQWNSGLPGQNPLTIAPPRPAWDGGFTYGRVSTIVSHKRPDMSNTQFALWALCTAKGAGYYVPDDVWTHALGYVLARQHLSGGFDYGPYPIYRDVSGARTAMGLMSLWFIKCWIGSGVSPGGNTIANINPAANNALTWWQNHYSYCCNPFETPTIGTYTPGDGYYYYVMSAARAFHHWGSLSIAPGPSYATNLGITASGSGYIPPACTPCPPTPIQHMNSTFYACPDLASISALWYNDFATELINSQVVSGSQGHWTIISPGWDGGNTIATLFALLALSRINLPPSMTPDNIRPIVDWTVPCDCECVCCDTCEVDSSVNFYISAHIQDGCCSQGINPASIHEKIDLACCPSASLSPSPMWIPDNSSGTSGTVVIPVRCDSLCDPENAFQCSYNSSYKVTVCLWANDMAGNPLFPDPYTWSFTIDRDSPWVEMYYPLCLTCQDTTSHVIWPQDTCCIAHFWDGYFKFATYHPCNLDCDTITITTWDSTASSEYIFTPEDPGITYKESYCTGELDSITVDLIKAIPLPHHGASLGPVPLLPCPPYSSLVEVDTCFDSLKVCLKACDKALDLSHLNSNGLVLPDTVVCHNDHCCWMFHNVHIYRKWCEPIGPSPNPRIRKIKGHSMLTPDKSYAIQPRRTVNKPKKQGCGCGKKKK